jgi:surface polysaccharide O-acyltransferase-like enzyme
MGNIKVRESNIELLRNISMFMILIIHANFVSLPHIQYNELTSNYLPSITRFLIESLGIVAVNVFVFISGWFGINTRAKGIFSFIYQILFFLLGGGHFIYSRWQNNL